MVVGAPPLVVHCWVDLQSVHGLRCYDNTARTRNVSECLSSLYAWFCFSVDVNADAFDARVFWYSRRRFRLLASLVLYVKLLFLFLALGLIHIKDNRIK